jgi:hypothetical protein
MAMMCLTSAAQAVNIGQLMAQKEQIAVLGAKSAEANEENACGKYWTVTAVLIWCC